MDHDLIIFDEVGDITPKMMRAAMRYARKQRAERGWFNWYVNRRRIDLSATPSELRRLSWRRAH